MKYFWVLIFVSFFATRSLDKAESVQLEELEDLPLQSFEELFVDEWWDKDEAEDLLRPPTNFGQNVHHQIDRQNAQLGQIEPNSTDQNAPLTESDHSRQNEKLAEDERKCKIIDKFIAIKEEFKQKGKYSKKEWTQIDNRIAKDLKASRSKIYKWKKEFGLSHKFYEKEERKHLVEKFDQMKAELQRDGFKSSFKNEINKTVAKKLGLHFKTIYKWKRKLGQTCEYFETNFSIVKNDEEQNEIASHENIAEDERKRKIIDKFHAMKDEFKLKQKYSKKEWVQIERKIAKHLKVNRKKIYKWKNELGQSRRNPKNERQNLIEKFDQMKAELKRAGLKNSYKNEINENVAKELGITDRTIYNWKREFSQTAQHKHSHSEQMELMKLYYEIKSKNPKISDEEIVKMLKIGTRRTLFNWKRLFKRQQLHPNSDDGHSVEENAAANVQEIGNSNPKNSI